jgi:queuine tRNA-ribosyltransferase
MMNAIYARDPRPIDETCGCYTCRHFSRAYLRHLIVAKEMLSGTLLSIHNIYTLVHLMQDVRGAIIAGNFARFAADFLAAYPQEPAEGAPLDI